MITITSERIEKEIKIITKGVIDAMALEKIRKKSEKILDDIRRFSDEDIGCVVLDFGGVTQISVEKSDWIACLKAFISVIMLSGREVILEGVDQEVCNFLDKTGLAKLICVRPRS